MKVILVAIAMMLFSFSVVALKMTAQLNSNGFSDLPTEGLGVHHEMCVATTEARVKLGHIVRQEEAMQFSTLACMLAKQL